MDFIQPQSSKQLYIALSKEKKLQIFSYFLLFFPPQYGLVDTAAFPHLKESFFPQENLHKIRVRLLAQLDFELTFESVENHHHEVLQNPSKPSLDSGKSVTLQEHVRCRVMHSQGNCQSLKNLCKVHFCRYFVIWSLID